MQAENQLTIFKGRSKHGDPFSFNAAQCLLFSGMSKGQDSNFLAVFDSLYSSSGPQKPQHKSGQKFTSLGAKNKVKMFYHFKRCLDFSQGIII